MKKYILALLIVFFLPAMKADDVQLVRIDVGVDSMTRTCYLHCPAQVPSGKAPLFIILHGAGGTPKGLVKLMKYRFNELSDMHGFYAAYPEGVGRTWNDLRNDSNTYAHRANIDDVGFFSALIHRLSETYPVDGENVFIVGFSNGGFMAFRLACELSQKISGIAVITATNPVYQAERCSPQRPLDVIIFNGTDDPIVPYNGGELRLLGRPRGSITSTDETVRYWKNINGCTGNAEAVDLPDIDPGDGTRVSKISYGPCRNGSRVVLYTVLGGGHTWPGGVQYFSKNLIGNNSRDISACDIIFDYFCGKK